MEDNIRLYPPPPQISPLPRDGCPTSPACTREALPKEPSTEAAVSETTYHRSPQSAELRPLIKAVSPQPPRTEHGKTPSTDSVKHKRISDSLELNFPDASTIDVTSKVFSPTQEQAMQVGISSESQLASIMENIVQEPPESPKQTGTDGIPLVSPIDAEFQAKRTALISQEIMQMDTDNSITTGPHTPPPSQQQLSGVPQKNSKERLSTETSAKESTHDDVQVNLPSPLVNVAGQPSFFFHTTINARNQRTLCLCIGPTMSITRLRIQPRYLSYRETCL